CPARGPGSPPPLFPSGGGAAPAWARRATEMLIRRIEGQQLSGPSQTLFDGELVVRASSGPAPSTR
ncbi:hypothetical protein ACFW9X_14060, partial [Streptomyces sp. NPDC059466]